MLLNAFKRYHNYHIHAFKLYAFKYHYYYYYYYHHHYRNVSIVTYIHFINHYYQALIL